MLFQEGTYSQKSNPLFSFPLSRKLGKEWKLRDPEKQDPDKSQCFWQDLGYLHINTAFSVSKGFFFLNYFQIQPHGEKRITVSFHKGETEVQEKLKNHVEEVVQEQSFLSLWRGC